MIKEEKHFHYMHEDGKTTIIDPNKEEEIIPPFMGENIERSKQRRKLIDEIINDMKSMKKDAWQDHWDYFRMDEFINRLEKVKEKLPEF